jgi:hypothetical protein
VGSPIGRGLPSAFSARRRACRAAHRTARGAAARARRPGAPQGRRRPPPLGPRPPPARRPGASGARPPAAGPRRAGAPASCTASPEVDGPAPHAGDVALRQVVRARSLLPFPPTDVLPGVACPPVGPVGRGSPPARSALGVQTRGTMPHDDCQPPRSPRVPRRWRRDPWPAAARCVPSPARGRPDAARPRQGSWSPATPPLPGTRVQEPTGSPQFPSAPLDDRPRAQPPVVSRGLRRGASRTMAFRRRETVGVPRPSAEGSPCGPPLDHVRGSIPRPVTWLPLAPRRHDWWRPSGALRTGGLGVRPVGRAPAVRTHWVTIPRFMKAHPLPRLRASLARPGPGSAKYTAAQPHNCKALQKITAFHIPSLWCSFLGGPTPVGLPKVRRTRRSACARPP